MKISYKTREVSTTEIYDHFDPPLTFLIKGRATEGWLDMIAEIAEVVNVSLAKKIMSGICYAVVDANGERCPTDEFYDSLKAEIPEMADQVFTDLAYALGISFLRETRHRIATLKKTQPASNGIAPDPAPLSASSEAS